MRRSGALRVLVAVNVLLVSMVFDTGSAFAVRVHAFSPPVFDGGTGGVLSLQASPPGELRTPGSGLAVNNATHDVYVADTGNHRIVEFTSSGAFVRAWGWGVATGAAKLEVCTSSCLPGQPGSQPGQFETPVYVAVDNSATSESKEDVYVGDTGDNLVTKFDAEGHLVSTWGNNGENVKKEQTEPNGQINGSPTEVFNKGNSGEPLAGLSVDSAGDLWALDSDSRLFEFKQDGTWVMTCSLQAGGVIVGGISMKLSCPESCAIYVLAGFRQVKQITPACGGGQTLTSGFAEVKGLAVDGSTEDLYADREGSWIEDIPIPCQPSPGGGCLASQTFGEEPPLGEEPPPPIEDATGLAVDPSSGAVYTANAVTEQIAKFMVVLEATTSTATGVGSAAATLHGNVNPVGASLSNCVFEYGTTTDYGASVPCDQSSSEIGTGSTLVPVTGKASGLTGGTLYHYRLRATNKHAVKSESNTVYSEDETFSTTAMAVIKEVAATKLTATSAVLQAKVNPSGLAASYHFEYGACDLGRGCATSPYTGTVPMSEGAIAAGSSDVLVQQPIVGLEANTTYHLRIVVTDANGVARSPEATFIDEPAASTCPSPRQPEDSLLADCRGYEMVTPPDKNGALIDNGAFMPEPLIAPDGSLVLAKSIQCFHAPPSCVGIRQREGEPYAFERTPSGWTTTTLAPPIAAGATMRSYSAETGVILYALAAVPPEREQMYARTPDGTFHRIGPIAEAAGVHVERLTESRIAANSDLSVLIYGNSHLWPSLEGGASGRTLLEYRGTEANSPNLVAVTGPAGSTSLISACGSQLGGPDPSEHGVLSTDARTVFFSVLPCAGGTGTNIGTKVPVVGLYARIEQSTGTATVHVSAPGTESECHTTCREQKPADAAFQGASTDGSRAYFTSTGQLTDNARQDSRATDDAYTTDCFATVRSASGCNLYEFECPNHCENVSERHLTDVSAGDTSGLGPQVQGVLAIAQDGSVVYFAARGVLTGANPEGQSPVPGSENLYAYRSGSSGGPGHIAFVATLTREDAAALWVHGRGLGSANLTPDGRYLLFASHRGLTSDATRSEGPAQIYRYDAQQERLLRISIGRDGFNDNGNASAGDAAIVPAGADLSIGQGPGHDNPSMSNDGQFVFFESPAGLAPNALDDQHVIGNGTVLAENVYEWAADGAKTSSGAIACEREPGCVSLITDGKDLIEGSDVHNNHSAVQLLGTDATGENVFFWTADPLVPADTDTQVDLYDARVNGGFPAPPAPPVCEAQTGSSGEACRGAGSTPGVFSAPGSVLFSGPPNPAGEAKPGGKPSPRGLTRAQKLKRTLAACRARYRTGKARGKRRVCERQARHRYGPVVGRSGGLLTGRGEAGRG
jgi:NHL repeat-containing protein